MGERKGTNHYYPPDFDPKKHGSLNGYHGVHALRERARKLDRGILIIRFEMPYNVWCLGCGNHIGMGVRYNAEKTKTGQYYSTPIYKFRMKCHLCDNHFEMQTDPANFEYVIICGLKRKEQRWNPDENEQIAPEEKKKHRKLESDPMFKLEHGKQDVEKAKKTMPSLAELVDIKEDFIDDFALNQASRRKFREEKKDLAEKKKIGDALLEKSSLPKDLPLVEESEEDRKLAALIKYKSVENYDERQAKKRKAIEDASVFPMTESGDINSSPLTKLKASFVSPGLAGRAHFANSMSGFGKVVRRARNAATHSPVETAISSQTETTTSSQTVAATSSPTETATSSRTETATSSKADDKILQSDSSASVQVSSIIGDSEDLPNPFKRTLVNDGMAGVGDKDSDEELGDNNNSNLLGLEEVPSQGTALEFKESPFGSEVSGSVPVFETSSQSEGNALSLLSGAYDGSSSENDSDW